MKKRTQVKLRLLGVVCGLILPIGACRKESQRLVDVEALVGPDLSLSFVLRNHGLGYTEMDSQYLPSQTAFVRVFTATDLGELPARTPDDPELAARVVGHKPSGPLDWPQGESIKDSISLGYRFPSIPLTLSTNDVVVVWAFQLRDKQGGILTNVIGTISVKAGSIPQ
jgi:hypothetical protein